MTGRTGGGVGQGSPTTLLGLFGAAAYLAIGGRVGAEADPPERIALGREVYDVHRAACHGADLKGAPGLAHAAPLRPPARAAARRERPHLAPPGPGPRPDRPQPHRSRGRRRLRERHAGLRRHPVGRRDRGGPRLHPQHLARARAPLPARPDPRRRGRTRRPNPSPVEEASRTMHMRCAAYPDRISHAAARA
jgi:hypothetical protein